MPLPRLPLEIVTYIVQLICQSYNFDSYHDPGYLYLRGISRFFDAEVFEIYAKHLNDLPTNHTLRVPEVFAARILHNAMGTHDPETSQLGRDLHAAVDVLLEQWECVGVPHSRKDVVRDVCRAIVRGETQNQWLLIYDLREQKDPLTHPSDPYVTRQTALVVAVVMKFEDVVHQMLSNGEASANGWSRHLHSPLPPAIRLGYTELTRLLLDTGAEIPERPFGTAHTGPRGHYYNAIVTAAKYGYMGVLEPLLNRDVTKELTHYVLHFAAAFGHWDLVTSILDHHLPREQWEITLTRKTVLECSCPSYASDRHNQPETFKLQAIRKVLHCAARDGKDEFLLKLINSGLTVRNNGCGTVVFPLQQAAKGGHFTTCKILLSRGALEPDPDPGNNTSHKRSRVDTLLRSTAIGGSLSVLSLFQASHLFTRTAALPILPLAASNGHLALVQHAIHHKWDMPPKLKTLIPEYHHTDSLTGKVLCLHCKRKAFQRDIRQLSLLLAVAHNHASIVRWLITACGADPGVPYATAENPSDFVPSGSDENMAPLRIAVDTGNVDMVRVLLDLGAEKLDARWSEDRDGEAIHRNYMVRRSIPEDLGLGNLDSKRDRRGGGYKPYKVASFPRRARALEVACGKYV